MPDKIAEKPEILSGIYVCLKATILSGTIYLHIGLSVLFKSICLYK